MSRVGIRVRTTLLEIGIRLYRLSGGACQHCELPLSQDPKSFDIICMVYPWLVSEMDPIDSSRFPSVSTVEISGASASTFLTSVYHVLVLHQTSKEVGSFSRNRPTFLPLTIINNLS
jgi:hypothetical protein